MPDKIIEYKPRVDQDGHLIGISIALFFDDGADGKAVATHVHPRKATVSLVKDPKTKKMKTVETGGETLAEFLAAVGYKRSTKKLVDSKLLAFERSHFAEEKAKALTAVRPVVIPVPIKIDEDP